QIRSLFEFLFRRRARNLEPVAELVQELVRVILLHKGQYGDSPNPTRSRWPVARLAGLCFLVQSVYDVIPRDPELTQIRRAVSGFFAELLLRELCRRFAAPRSCGHGGQEHQANTGCEPHGRLRCRSPVQRRKRRQARMSSMALPPRWMGVGRP